MRFLSNFEFKIIFMCSVNFWNQQDSNSLFKWSVGHLLVQVACCSFTIMNSLMLPKIRINATFVKFQLTKQISRSYAFAMLPYFIQFSANEKHFSTVLDKNVSTCSLRAWAIALVGWISAVFSSCKLPKEILLPVSDPAASLLRKGSR